MARSTEYICGDHKPAQAQAGWWECPVPRQVSEVRFVGKGRVEARAHRHLAGSWY